MGYRVVVVGTMGNIGTEILKVLAERQFPIDKIRAVAPSISRGQQVSFGDNDVLDVIPITDFDFHGFDFAFFSTGNLVSAEFVPIAAEAGCIVIDSSSHFRQEPEIPLIVPEVNPEALGNYRALKIIATPNSMALSLAMALKPLQDAAGIRHVVVTTFQSVSGEGRAAMDELFNQTRAIFMNQPVIKEEFPKQIAFNIIPQCDNFLLDGTTAEETRISLETPKILGINVGIAATCVRVPVFIGHSMAVAVELENPLTVLKARFLWKKYPGLSLVDFRPDDGYITPVETVGEDSIFISRIREDKSVKHGLLFWLAHDNLRKGTALNAVQIAERIISDFLETKNSYA